MQRAKKLLVEVEAKIFWRNDKVKVLEAELEQKEEELAERAKKLKQENPVSAQLQRELRDEKAKVCKVYKKVESMTDAIILKHPNLMPPT